MSRPLLPPPPPATAAMTLPALIAFTPAQDSSDLWKDGRQQPQSQLEPELPLDGAAARDFYESVVGSTGDAPTRSPIPKRASPKGRKRTQKTRLERTGAVTAYDESVGARERQTAQLLRAAQDGDVRQLRALLEPRGPGTHGGDINARDAAWWTPLMCAARAGQGPAVRYLLARGAAWVGVCELGGRDAAQLAEEAGYFEVARIVRESGGEEIPESRPCSPLPKKYCETCGSHYRDSNHNSSTAHLLALSHGPRPPHLPQGVSASSPGFKLLVKGGWEPGLGLGPRGEGRTAPIPTVLKRDQEGLGYRPTPQPRVTHFPARDPQAVAERKRAPRAATLSKREEKRLEEKRRAWEWNLRTYMNLDL
ncbi:G patch domain and ankyrin repeat-containing protein 1 [Gracilinanus agilis]|uniref:G patch domain and ankyrin repeat-containing protein 1 n=1 Tax=Gracilinanus agilis TaxID=191870 RepID=UPI001CFD7E90|nr:G patch domain and ankyrin repeat-containing protein 1 [Gracilinanus agilis]